MSSTVSPARLQTYSDQWKKYNLPEIEWYDILRYGVAIVIGSGLQGLALQYFFEM